METTGIIGILEGYIGIIGLYRGSIIIMEKNMETTIMGLYRDYRVT